MEFSKETKVWPNETFSAAAGAVVGNLLAAGGASVTFLSGNYRFVPLAIAGTFAVLSALALWPLMRAWHRREHHAALIQRIKAES